MNHHAVAVMQPYLFPYIGYFHLIKSVDLFVSFDDVNFIKKGWINRNRILLNNSGHPITLPIQKISQNKKINESFIFEHQKQKNALVKLIIDAYKKKAPFFEENIDKIKELILSSEDNIAIYNTNNLQNLSEYLEIKTKFIFSSQVPQDLSATGENKILKIVKHFGATTYINASGGVNLYDKKFFSDQNIELKFVPSYPVIYNQRTDQFIPNLSIIDGLMYAGRSKLIEFLNLNR